MKSKRINPHGSLIYSHVNPSQAIFRCDIQSIIFSVKFAPQDQLSLGTPGIVEAERNLKIT